MSDEKLSPVEMRNPFKDEQVAIEKLSEACYALQNMFPGIKCYCKAGCGESYVSFRLIDSEDLRRFAYLIHAMSMHIASALRPDEASKPTPRKIIYNHPATIVLWDDGTKTVVKCSEHDSWNPETGFLWALAEKLYGSKSQVDKVMGRWLRDAGQER